MAIRSRKPTSAGRRFQTSSDFAEITKTTPEKYAARRPLSKSGGRNVYGRKTVRHRGGGHKRQYRIIDFTPYQGRRDRQGRRHRVRPQPHLPHRPAALRRRREGLHPGAQGPQRRRPRVAAVTAPTSSRATRCRCATSRSVPPCTTSSCAPAAAARWPARPAWPCSWSPRKASSPPCACPPPRCAACSSTAAPPSARSATASTS